MAVDDSSVGDGWDGAHDNWGLPAGTTTNSVPMMVSNSRSKIAARILGVAIIFLGLRSSKQEP